MPPRLRGFGLGALLLAALPAAAAAQGADAGAYPAGLGRVTVGGELSAAFSPSDDEAWFNYTGYEQNALRMARLRLFGEWHAADRVSVVGEVRAESPSNVTAPALYLRWQPSASLPLHVQAGRIPPLVGAFSRRAYGRDNAVIGLPLAYQYLTSLRAEALPLSIDDVIAMRGRGWLATYPIGSYDSGPGVPLVAIDAWDTGAEATWRTTWVDVSAAVTRGAPAVPVLRETNDGLMLSARTTARLPAGIVVGLSGARGQWIERDVLRLTPDGAGSASTQSMIGADAEVGHGPWLMRAEWLRTRFELPLAATAPGGIGLGAWSGFVEGRYRPHPRWQFGGRFDRLAFDRVTGSVLSAGPIGWDAGVTRVEGTIGFRATRSTEVRAGWQQNWRAGGRVERRGDPVAAILYWF